MIKSKPSDEVFILGAGFSKSIDWGFPTLKELGDAVMKRIENEVLKSHLEEIPLAIKENLETLLSYLAVDMPWKTPSKRNLDRGAFEALLPEISKVILSPFSDKKLKLNKNVSSIYSLISYIHQNNIPMINFNYDLCVEDLFKLQKGLDFKIHGIVNENVYGKKYELNYSIEVRFIGKWQKSKEKPYSFPEETQIQVDKDFAYLHTYLNVPSIYEEDCNYDLIKEEIMKVLKKSLGFPDSFFEKVSEKIKGEFLRKVIELKTPKKQERGVPWHDLYQMPLKRMGDRSGAQYWGSDQVYSRAHLLKLHGSVNWYYSGTNTFPSEQLYYSHNLEETIENTQNNDLMPFIIPPVLDKNQFYFHTALRHLWFKAGEYLRNAKNIYFIGYSMPETDIASKLLFQENIQNANVFIVNKTSEKEALVSRYAKAFGSNNKMDFEFVDSDDIFEKFITWKLQDLY